MINVVAIEDEPEILDTIIDTLEAEGLEVSGAENGSIGLELVQNTLPELVICDVMMPQLDGFEVLYRLRQNEHTAAIPVVFLTARSERESMRKGMELGADDYVSKPFTSAELVATVKAQLQKRTTIAKKYESSMNVLRSNIIYALPHELRTPLMGILGYSELLRDDALKGNLDTVVDMATMISRAGHRLERLFENYLVYAQLEIMQGNEEQIQGLRNHLLSQPEQVIADVACACAERHERLADLKLELIANTALRMSRENLTKLIDVLVDNAFKFSKPQSPISIETAYAHDIYTIQARDRGRGMTVEQIKNLGAYMQFGRALHEQQGLGLGFTIARRMVALHAGKIDVVSAPNEGTVVTVSLPTN